jgi:hypothetical protein
MYSSTVLYSDSSILSSPPLLPSLLVLVYFLLLSSLLVYCLLLSSLLVYCLLLSSLLVYLSRSTVYCSICPGRRSTALLVLVDSLLLSFFPGVSCLLLGCPDLLLPLRRSLASPSGRPTSTNSPACRQRTRASDDDGSLVDGGHWQRTGCLSDSHALVLTLPLSLSPSLAHSPLASFPHSLTHSLSYSHSHSHSHSHSYSHPHPHPPNTALSVRPQWQARLTREAASLGGPPPTHPHEWARVSRPPHLILASQLESS